MKPLKYTVAALAVIAVASLTTSAMAANTGDLIFGVYDANTGATTVATSYELDLGAFNTLSVGETWNLGSTVSSLYASDESASLLWDIGGAGSAGASGGGLAKKEVAVTAESLPTLPSFGGNTTEAGNISTETNTFASGTNIALPSTTSSNSTAISAVSVSNGTGAFANQIGAGGTDGYGYGAGLEDTYPSTDSVNFYTILNSASQESATSDGVFQLSVNGSGQEILTYDPVATPEPSAYALGLCAVALFWVLKRRRSVA